MSEWPLLPAKPRGGSGPGSPWVGIPAQRMRAGPSSLLGTRSRAEGGHPGTGRACGLSSLSPWGPELGLAWELGKTGKVGCHCWGPALRGPPRPPLHTPAHWPTYYEVSASTAQPRNLSRASPPPAQQAPLAAGIWTSQGGIPLSGLRGGGVQHGWLRGWLLEPQFCPRAVLLTVHSQPLPVAPQPHPVQCAPLWRDHPWPRGLGWVPPHTRSAWGLHLLLGGASHWDGCFLVVQQRK